MSYEAGTVAQKALHQTELSLSETILSSKWFGIAMCVIFIAGLILASITASPTVSHAIGTTIPGATGGSLMIISLLGLLMRCRTNGIIESRAQPSLFGILKEARDANPNYDPNKPPPTPEEARAILEQEIAKQKAVLDILNDD